MPRAAVVVFAVCWVTAAPIAARAGGAAVEGVVTMAPAAPAPAVAPRCPLAATYEVAPPDAPVAVVYLETGAPPAAPDPRAQTPRHLAEKILQSKSHARRRAQAGHGAVRRRQGIDGAGRSDGPGSVVRP